MATIRNPIEWSADQFREAASHLASVGRSLGGTEASVDAPRPAIRRIEIADLKDVLQKGFADFGACRTDVIFLCLVYPVAGLVLARLAFGYEMLPLLFPIMSGFALLGPVAAVGLYEMSRRRELGETATWADAFGMVRSPSFGSIVAMGLLLVGLFLLWLAAAQIIYTLTLGPEPPVSIAAFIGDVFLTGAGWAMIVIGMGVGFLFALLVLTISVVSFPMLLDKDAGVGLAIWTSVHVVKANPRTIAAWGLIVAGGLVLGSIPAFLGLIFVMPVLGHATWHLYRRTVER
ncbi:MAG: DUF2189 domain-containing protein [Minwuiales bacterium]|nr:DUF2189 domain-containing protein [Minwuiales bacterium]